MILWARRGLWVVAGVAGLQVVHGASWIALGAPVEIDSLWVTLTFSTSAALVLRRQPHFSALFAVVAGCYAEPVIAAAGGPTLGLLGLLPLVFWLMSAPSFPRAAVVGSAVSVGWWLVGDRGAGWTLVLAVSVGVVLVSAWRRRAVRALSVAVFMAPAAGVLIAWAFFGLELDGSRFELVANFLLGLAPVGSVGVQLNRGGQDERLSSVGA